ncbi:MAG: hypothetical protein KJ578_03120 [Bacteroidetes bacterium]|nr:hypothetical protein [Bacteroidota bacterium]
MRCIVLIMFLAVFGIQSSLAQTSPEKVVLSSNGVEMLPYKTGSCATEEFYDQGFINTLPKHTVNLYEEKFDQLISAFKQHHVLNPPTGFEAKFQKRMATITKPSKPAFFFPKDDPKTTGWIEVYFSPYYLENGNPTVNWKFSTFFQIYLNNPYVIAGTPLMADIYTCPQQVDNFHGHAVYATNREEVTIINFSGQPLFIPVSQENFIHVVMAYWEQNISEEKAEKTDYMANTNDEIKSVEKQRQKQDFEHTYNELLKYDKKAAADLKKTYDEIVALNLSETHDETVFDNAASFAQSQIISLKEELAAMSPAERARQGIYDVNAFEMFNNVSGLMPESHKAVGDALVRINPDLVDASPEKIQLLSIHWNLLDEAFDKPRSSTVSEDSGFITDNKLLSIYSDSEFWKKLFQTVQK